MTWDGAGVGAGPPRQLIVSQTDHDRSKVACVSLARPRTTAPEAQVAVAVVVLHPSSHRYPRPPPRPPTTPPRGLLHPSSRPYPRPPPRPPTTPPRGLLHPSSRPYPRPPPRPPTTPPRGLLHPSSRPYPRPPPRPPTTPPRGLLHPSSRPYPRPPPRPPTTPPRGFAGLEQPRRRGAGSLRPRTRRWLLPRGCSASPATLAPRLHRPPAATCPSCDSRPRAR